jgi:U3 small nucleolar RNA-associated protein 14
LACVGGSGADRCVLQVVQRAPEIDMDEEEEDPDDEEGGNYMDASEMLDTGEFDSEVDSSEAESGSGSEEEDDDEVDEDEEMDSEVDSEYEGALDKLSSFVDGLESKKRRMDDDDESGKKKKRIVLKERTEAYPEGEFVAVSAPEGVNDCESSLPVTLVHG